MHSNVVELASPSGQQAARKTDRERVEEREAFEAFEIKSLSSSTRLIFPKVKY